MKRTLLIFAGFAIVAGWWLLVRSPHRVPTHSVTSLPASSVATGVSVTVVSTPTAIAPHGQPRPLLGETILREYGKPSLPPENDLTLLARLMENFSLLVKSAAGRPFSANEDWAAAFRGQNPACERFLPDQHKALNPQGQLMDRWGTPLFFHALGRGRFDIRSAGPDRKLWTGDDIHRNAKGSFRRGGELNPPSLLDAAQVGP